MILINKNVIRDKMKGIQRDLIELAKFKDLSFEKLIKDYQSHKVVERIIELVINEAIDINQHLIVKSKKKDLPFDFRESFLILADLGVYPKKFAKEIADSVGLRNILVHQYRKLDEKLFYESINDCLKQYTKYCKYILRLVNED